jgi:hypothetical protein
LKDEEGTEFSKYWKIISEKMIGNGVISEVDTPMYVVISKAVFPEEFLWYLM